MPRPYAEIVEDLKDWGEGYGFEKSSERFKKIINELSAINTAPHRNHGGISKIGMQEIKLWASEYFGENIFKETRKRPYPQNRAIVFQIARNEHLTWWDIADASGNTHATVINGVKKTLPSYRRLEKNDLKVTQANISWEEYKRIHLKP